MNKFMKFSLCAIVISGILIFVNKLRKISDQHKASTGAFEDMCPYYINAMNGIDNRCEEDCESCQCNSCFKVMHDGDTDRTKVRRVI